jgi:hypothetical protein
MFYNIRQCEVTYGKYALKQGNRIGVRFIKYDIQGVFLKCVEILPTRLFDNVEAQKQLKKNLAQKINVILFFDIEFFLIFFPSST